MKDKLITIGVIVAAILALYVLYRVTFIRTVNYEIGGVKIPSRYNAFTGTVKPIQGYDNKKIATTMTDRRSDKVGLSDEQVVAAQLRWSVFEEWVNSHNEFAGWQEDPDIFKKAHEAFKREMASRGPRFNIVK